MRFWARTFRDNRSTRELTITNDSDDTRTHKVFAAIDTISAAFDLSHPIWLESNIKDFKAHSKVKFYKDSFIDDIDFDFLEFTVLEED